MTLSSVTIARRAQWGDAIVDFGWRMTRGHIDQRAGLVLACADRPVRAGPAMTLTVREEWVPGPDPDGLGLCAHGCFLRRASWHAQIGLEPPAEHAHRLDVDRDKSDDAKIHLHPFGHPNQVRLPRRGVGTPEQWLVAIEDLYFEWYA